MPSLYAEIDINAPQSVVWEALMRKDQWRFWNTFLYDCDPGMRLARGNEIFLAMQRLEGDEETEFQPLITMVRPPSMMRWVSTIPGLRTEHIFELRENVPGRTRYIHREVFSGILSKVFLPFIRQDERQGLRRMTQQLKMHVEQTVLGNGPDPRDYQNRYPDPRDAYGRPAYDRPDYGRPDYNRPDYNRPDYGRPNYNDRPYDDRRYDDRRPRNNRGYDDRNDYPPQ
ncbi:MAG: SRPBCC domain-containing protein, partial [Cyanobacteria bacterium J06627_28]